MGFGEAEDGEPLGRIALEPVGEFRMPGPVRRDQPVEGGLCAFDPLRAPHLPQFGPDPLPDWGGGSPVEGVALQMALAALPSCAGKRCPACGAQPGMVVRDDVLHPAHAAGDEAVEELAPVDLRFRERDGHPQHAPPADGRVAAVGHDADRREDGGVADDPVNAHLLVASVENEISRLREPAGVPSLQLLVEPLGRVADLGGGHALDPHDRQHVLDVAG